jgi:hypothetical protein
MKFRKNSRQATSRRRLESYGTFDMHSFSPQLIVILRYRSASRRRDYQELFAPLAASQIPVTAGRTVMGCIFMHHRARVKPSASAALAVRRLN